MYVCITDKGCARTGTDCGIYMDKYGNIGQNDSEQEILDSNRGFRISHNLLSWACMCWALVLKKYAPEKDDKVFTMYKNVKTSATTTEKKVLFYAITQLSRHFEELTKNVFALAPVNENVHRQWLFFNFCIFFFLVH